MCRIDAQLAILEGMTHTLFAGSIACFTAVLLVALAVARRIRSKRNGTMKSAHDRSTQEFFPTGEFRTPRPLTLKQELPRRPLAEITFTLPASTVGRGTATADLSPVRPVSLFGSPLSSPARIWQASPLQITRIDDRQTNQAGAAASANRLTHPRLFPARQG